MIAVARIQASGRNALPRRSLPMFDPLMDGTGIFVTYDEIAMERRLWKAQALRARVNELPNWARILRSILHASRCRSSALRRGVVPDIHAGALFRCDLIART
ncbi:hypothetical protein [Paraburkholderia sp. BL6669N2]|uniref:hypothetical protein n=1 Tax=Paraburkholderia sp. BL6669N2 TaxID=1938807 RepID=UPI0011C054C0|nr:hypothetical protein [Paraburkholderia sp. BL6669N2]